MQVHSKTIQVTKDDLDELEHVNNVRYVQWIQDISKEHWLGVASPDILKGSFWVVRHHDIHYKRAAVLGDTIHIKTYITATKGALSFRVVEMSDATNGSMLVYSKTAWCLINANTLKPMRITDAISRLFLPEKSSRA